MGRFLIFFSLCVAQGEARTWQQTALDVTQQGWGLEVAQCCSEHIKGEEVLPVPNWSVLLDTGLAWEAYYGRNRIVKSRLLCIITLCAMFFNYEIFSSCSSQGKNKGFQKDFVTLPVPMSHIREGSAPVKGCLFAIECSSI